MLSTTRSFLSWLDEAEHVARFQRYFGILPIADHQPDLIPNVEKKKFNKNNSNNTESTAAQVLDGLYHRHHERKVTYDTNVLDECIEEMKHSTNQGTAKQPKSPEVDYRVTAWFWYYFFQLGTSLGNEIFYILFFPTWSVSTSDEESSFAFSALQDMERRWMCSKKSFHLLGILHVYRTGN
jgi:hypothetical protein